MAVKIIKQVNIKATFPGGRVVDGFTNVLPTLANVPFQVWVSEKHDGSEVNSVIINPLLAETVDFEIQYETPE
ncbi:hypothetical protein [Hafnia paralvei]|uniref:hypothetical protein n=1 Tax=Hafnia paralvei TaxID=546367 RepID=UPI0038CFF047